MKRIISMCLVISLFLILFPISASALEVSEQTIYLDDGNYIIVTIESYDLRASGTKTGSKTYTGYYGGSAAWKVILSGTFTYTGSSATCTDSGCSTSVYNSEWYTVSKSAGKSSNAATANASMGRKVLGVTVETVPVNLKLTCDANGNLS